MREKKEKKKKTGASRPFMVNDVIAALSLFCCSDARIYWKWLCQSSTSSLFSFSRSFANGQRWNSDSDLQKKNVPPLNSHISSKSKLHVFEKCKPAQMNNKRKKKWDRRKEENGLCRTDLQRNHFVLSIYIIVFSSSSSSSVNAFGNINTKKKNAKWMPTIQIRRPNN